MAADREKPRRIHKPVPAASGTKSTSAGVPSSRVGSATAGNARSARHLARGAVRTQHPQSESERLQTNGANLPTASSAARTQEPRKGDLHSREPGAIAGSAIDTLNEVMSGISDGFAMLDRNWRLIYANENIVRLAGLPRSDLVGKNVWETFPQLVGTNLWHELHRALDQQAPAHFEFLHAPTNRWSEHHVYPSSSGLSIFCADITDRKFGEQVLREKEERLRFTLEAANVGTWEWDIQTDKVRWSQNMETIHGQPAGTFGEKFESFLLRVHPDDRDLVLGRINRAIELGVDYAVEYRMMTADESVKWVQGRGRIFRDEARQPIRMMGVCWDITERKQRFNLLTFQANILAQVSDAVFALDEKQRVIYWNKAAESLYGYKLDEVMGLPVAEVVRYQWIKPEDEPACVKAVQTSGFWQGEVIHHKKSGEEVYIDGSVTRLDAGSEGGVSYLMVNRDASMRKRAEKALQQAHDELERRVRERTSELSDAITALQSEAEDRIIVEEELRESEQRLQSVMDSNPSIMFMKDTRGRYMYVNPQFRKICDLPSEEILDKTDEDLFPPQQAQTFRGNDLVVLQTGVPLDFEEVAEHKDGPHTGLVTKFPLRDAKGKVYAICGIATDITARKKAEQELQGANEALSEQAQLLDLAHDAIIVRDPKSTIVFWNPGAHQTYGWPREQAVGKNTHELLHTEFPEPREAIEQKILSGGFWEGELIHTRRDGRQVTVLSRQVLQRDRSWRPIGVMEINRDITERKQAERALQANEARLRALVESMDDMAFEMDEHGTYLNVWTNNEGLLVRPRRELIGRRMSEVLDKNLASLFADTFRRVLASGRPEVLDYSLDLPAGARRFSARVTLIRSHHNLETSGNGRCTAGSGSGKGAGLSSAGQAAPNTVCLVVRDITDREAAEAAAHASEERFRLLVEGVKDYAIYMVDADGHVLSWNRGAERIKGYKRDEIIGKHYSVFYPAEDIQAGKPQLHLRIAAEEGQVESEGWRVRKDGSRFWASTLITPLYDEHDGHLRGFSKVTRDITERKKAEEALRELSGRVLAAQDQERRRLARELHDSTAQTLAALSLNLSTLAQSANLGESPAASKALAESINLADEACDELRTFSYLLHPPLLDEAGLYRALRWYVDGFSRRAGLQVDLQVPSDHQALSQDLQVALFRIVQESLTNIHRHSGSPKAEIRIATDAERVTLEVRDYGRGVPSIPDEPHGGGLSDLGVGIRGMRERVRQLGGTMEISSADPGTRVQAVLPLSQPPIE